MQMLVRKIHLRQINVFKSQNKLSLSSNAILNNINRNDFVVKSFLPDIVFPKMRFIDRLWRDKASFEKHVAVECAETKRSCTYEQLQKSSAAYATSLVRKLGLTPGDVVAAMLPNCPEFAVVAVGTLHAGCVMTPINPMYKEFEINHQIANTEPKVVITIPECYDSVLRSLKATNVVAKIVIVASPNTQIPNGTVRFSDIAEYGEADYSILDKIERNLDDTAIIVFSSGTTGMPKGVELTNKNLFAALEGMHDERTCFPKLTDGSFQDTLPCVLPFFHVFGLVIALYGHLAKGCKFITMPKFSASMYFEMLKNQKCTLLYLVPPIAHLLAKHPEVNESYFRNVRHILCGAAPITAAEVEALLRKGKNKMEFNQGYGSTETTSLSASTLINYTDIDFNACGVPMASMAFKFADPQSGSDVPIGETGEILVKGPLVMKGYRRNEKATTECITEDGFYKTGDLGYYKPGVGLFVTDRIKELIKVKGMQVAPAELESILRSHPAVLDAAVVGIPHELYGEAPIAFITPKSGVKASAEELKDYVASKVAAYKKIEDVIFIDSIPKSSTGKILRKELKKMTA